MHARGSKVPRLGLDIVWIKFAACLNKIKAYFGLLPVQDAIIELGYPPRARSASLRSIDCPTERRMNMSYDSIYGHTLYAVFRVGSYCSTEELIQGLTSADPAGGTFGVSHIPSCTPFQGRIYSAPANIKTTVF